jgi:hypothetical protein
MEHKTRQLANTSQLLAMDRHGTWQVRATRDAYRNLVRKHDGKVKLSRPRCRTEGVIEIYLKEISLIGGGMD